MISLGTSGTVYAVSSTPAVDPTGAVAGFADAAGLFLPLVCTLNATKVTDATGLWSGLRTSTTRAELARSAHEGVVRSLLDGLEALKSTGAKADRRLFLIGGGAKSAAYRQITATMHGAPIVVPGASETVAAGACVQAAWMAGHQIGEIAGGWGEGAMRVQPSCNLIRG